MYLSISLSMINCKRMLEYDSSIKMNPSSFFCNGLLSINIGFDLVLEVHPFSSSLSSLQASSQPSCRGKRPFNYSSELISPPNIMLGAFDRRLRAILACVRPSILFIIGGIGLSRWLVASCNC